MIALGSDHGGLCPAEPCALCGDPDWNGTGRNRSAPCQGFALRAKRLDGVTAGRRCAAAETRCWM